MKWSPRPTLLGLVLIGFLVVALPLLVAIVTAIAQVQEFARKNHEALATVQENTAAVRAFTDRAAELERSARQFQALQDVAYRDLYLEHRTEVEKLLDLLSDASRDTSWRASLEQVTVSERLLYDAVAALSAGRSVEDLDATMTAFRDDLVALVREQNAYARARGNEIPEQAGALQRLLVGQAALVIPISAGLALVFVILINRPLRQIGTAIRTLGRGDYRESVQVSGTSDLDELGGRLEWLRMRLMALEAQKTLFLRSVSHELKTPLTNIREASELLVGSFDSSADPEQHKIARILQTNSLRLQRMIEELLRFGADNAAQPGAKAESVALHLLIRGVAETYLSAIEERGIELRLDLPAVHIDVNSQQLRVIVDNLLSNALKYTPPGGRIDIVLAALDNRVVVDLTDTGPGIRAEDTSKLFEWFYTGPRPEASIVAGTGVGLAIAQEYANQNAGRIEVLERSSGAHFRLTLGRAHDKNF